MIRGVYPVSSSWQSRLIWVSFNLILPPGIDDSSFTPILVTDVVLSEDSSFCNM